VANKANTFNSGSTCNIMLKILYTILFKYSSFTVVCMHLYRVLAPGCTKHLRYFKYFTKYVGIIYVNEIFYINNLGSTLPPLVLHLSTIMLITFALWYSIQLCALCSHWTVFVVTALNWSMASIMIRVSYCTNWTQAFVGSSSIVTSSTWATWWVRTEINQLATYPWISSIPWLAVTNLKEWLLLYYVTILDYAFLLNFCHLSFFIFTSSAYVYPKQKFL
jgi:hypothetical protein